MSSFGLNINDEGGGGDYKSREEIQGFLLFKNKWRVSVNSEYKLF